MAGMKNHTRQEQSEERLHDINHGEEALSQTRICIKNLPLSMVLESDLRNFLHEQLLSTDVTITDCKILKRENGKSRRMAFVGFSSAAMASRAIELLHKSYCHSARLVVEYAQLPKRNTTTTSDVATIQENPEVLVQEKKTNVIDQRKQEFLDAMGVSENQTTKSRKFWANDDGDIPSTMNTEENDINHNKKSIDEQPIIHHTSSSESSSSDNSSDDDDDADPLRSSAVATKSAMDFLKSKQITTENLEEDENLEQQDEKEPDAVGTEAGSSDEESVAMMKSSANDNEHHQPVDQNQSDDHQHDNNDNMNFDDNEEVTGPEDDAIMPNRLFLRNLPFSATEEDIRNHLEPYGTITECHIPVDDQKHAKGFAFVTFENASQAQAAMESLDGHDFQGRLLHILPARKIATNNTDDKGFKHLSYKEQKERARQEEASKKTAGWSASFVRGDAVVDNLATRLGLRKGEILSVKDALSSGDAAVRLALGETAIIEENRKYFAEHGYDMEALVSLHKSNEAGKDNDIPRSKTAFLVKNLPFDTTKDELLKLFSLKGETPSKLLLPPSRTIAVVEYVHANDAKVAFRQMAYRRFKSVPLYLEWAPLDSKLNTESNEDNQQDNIQNENDVEEADQELGPTAALYITNLNFSTSEDQLFEFFSKHVKDVRAVRIPKKVAAVKRKSGETDDVKELSMGYGFVEFGSKESAREMLKKLQGSLLHGHALHIKPSSSRMSVNPTSGSKAAKQSSKLMVRNVPFQATRKELLQLFGSFGQLKKVRLPKKFDGSHRGFAFVEYLTSKEGAAAMKSLSRTHLYGRHLVIEWAAEDEEVEDLAVLREKAERDIAPQGKKIRFS